MYKLFKRFLDLGIAGTTLLVFSPMFITIVVVLMMTGEKYVFYFQKRIGYKNQYFDIWKFATMLKDSPNLGSGSITLRDDPRVTPIGRFLRKTKLNEFPQIINVILGNLSIVGPRPLVDMTFNAYSKTVRKNIYNVKPGITGIGSIIFRDEEYYISKSDLSPFEYYKTYVAPYKGELEMWYHRNMSFSTDIKIIFLTLWVVIFPKSNLTYKIFSTLPKRPLELSVTEEIYP